MPEEEKKAYSHYIKQTVFEQSVIEDALYEGKAEGFAEGKAEREHKKAVAVALQAIQMGLSIEDASKLSGLTGAQIQEIINSN